MTRAAAAASKPARPRPAAMSPCAASCATSAVRLLTLPGNMRAKRPRCAGSRLTDPQRADRLADEVTPLVAHPGLVRRRRLGDGQPGAAEHPEGELNQAVKGAAVQAPAFHQIPDEPLDQAVGVLPLAITPAVPAQRGGALQPDQSPVRRVAAVVEVGAEREHGRLPRVGRLRGGEDLRGHPGLLQFEHRLEQRLLAGEVVINGTARHLARRRHVLQRGPAVPALGEQRGRLFQQRGPGGLRVHLTAALDLGHTPSIVTYAEYVTIKEYVCSDCEGRWGRPAKSAIPGRRFSAGKGATVTETLPPPLF